jgi:ATP-dependent RNA circularization protein (DNA/RNA ligase family)
VVQFCAHKAGKFPFTNYIILGDDIVVKDNKVARNYISFMNKLGVDISLHKTHVSKDTYEFAKRWIR